MRRQARALDARRRNLGLCGLAVIVDPSQRGGTSSLLDRMLASLAHRGPDDIGTLIDGHVALGFRRLSILDLSPLGHQPMSTEDDALTIIFNGEIYNFREVKCS